jgi:hypothetical protein
VKDINKLKNYREKYKRHYNIDFGSEYVVHHIDENRQNNDISNLLLLPRDLHSKYHTYKLQHMMTPFYSDLSYSSSISRSLYRTTYNDFEKVLEEAEQWVNLKHSMDMGYKEAYDMFEKYTKKRKNK